jgi:hypothetical protein
VRVARVRLVARSAAALPARATAWPRWRLPSLATARHWLAALLPPHAVVRPSRVAPRALHPLVRRQQLEAVLKEAEWVLTEAHAAHWLAEELYAEANGLLDTARTASPSHAGRAAASRALTHAERSWVVAYERRGALRAAWQRAAAVRERARQALSAAIIRPGM